VATRYGTGFAPPGERTEAGPRINIGVGGWRRFFLWFQTGNAGLLGLLSQVAVLNDALRSGLPASEEMLAAVLTIIGGQERD